MNDCAAVFGRFLESCRSAVLGRLVERTRASSFCCSWAGSWKNSSCLLPISVLGRLLGRTRAVSFCCSWSASWSFLKVETKPCSACQPFANYKLRRFLVMALHRSLPGYRIISLNSCRVIVLFSIFLALLVNLLRVEPWRLLITVSSGLLLGYHVIFIEFMQGDCVISLNLCR